VAITGDAAKAAVALANQLDEAIGKMRSTAEADLPAEIAAVQKLLASPGLPLRAKRRGQLAVAEMQAKLKTWEKSQKASGAGGGTDAVAAAAGLLASADEIGGGKLIVGEIAGASADGLLSAVDSLRKKAGSYAILLAAEIDGKASFVAAVSDDLIAKGLKAGDWVRQAAKVAGGGGGGRPNLAQAGGKDPAKIGEALAAGAAFARSAVQ
jgi:alanyl-tRNA synthetase